MAMHAAPRAPRRPAPRPSHPTTAVLVLVLVILGLANQCGSEAETSDSAPAITTPAPTSPAPLAEAPQPAGNETANGGQSAPAELPEPAPALVPTRAPAPAGDSADTHSDDSGPAYYKNCAAARAAGVTPLYTGDPGYSSKLDRDGDGVACE